MSTVIGLLGSAAALLAFIGTATLFVLRGKQQDRVRKLEETAGDLRKDVVDRDGRITFCESELVAAKARVKSLEEHVRVLENVKLSEAYLTAMESTLTAHSAMMREDHGKILTELGIVRNQNRDMLALLADKRRNP